LPKKIDDYYNSIANGYDLLHGSEQQKKIKLIIDLIASDKDLNIRSDSILFDVGCGTGISTNILPCLCFGLDSSIELLKQANNSLKIHKGSEALGFIHGIAEEIPVKNNACTIVVSVTAMHNFKDIIKGLDELSRVAKKRVVISILKKAENREKIIKLIKEKFVVLNTVEDDFDVFFYLKPL
jgi:ubiquinone/menaquinone biosynthesis C-methylase UbiE